MQLRLTSNMSSLADPFVQRLCVALTDVGPHQVVWSGERDRIGAMRRRHADIGWVCGLLHATLKAQGRWPFRPLAAPVMAAERYGGRPTYFGDVVVAASSELTTFDSLAGTVFAFNETASWSGYRMMADRLESGGHDLTWFGATLESGSHLASIELVASGIASCAVIDSTILDMAPRRGVEMQGIRAIDALGPYPAPPFVIHEEIAGAVRDDLRRALRLVGARAFFADWSVHAFEPVTREAYSSLGRVPT